MKWNINDINENNNEITIYEMKESEREEKWNEKMTIIWNENEISMKERRRRNENIM